MLSKMLMRLLQDHDSVSLPGMGSFVVKQEPAWFSDKGYTINPPGKRLSFVSGVEDDGLLVDYYAASNGIERAVAEDYIRRFASEMLEVLKRKKTLVLEGLGRLRATRENAVFFVADPDLNLDTDNIPLRSVSLKSLVNEESVEISVPVRRPEVEDESEPEVVAEEAQMVAETVTEPEPELEPEREPEQEPEPEMAAEPEPEPEPELEVSEPVIEPVVEKAESATEPVVAEEMEVKPSRRRIPKACYIVPLVLVCIALLCLAVFLVLCEVAPDFVDSLLYTQEELKIINY